MDYQTRRDLIRGILDSAPAQRKWDRKPDGSYQSPDGYTLAKGKGKKWNLTNKHGQTVELGAATFPGADKAIHATKWSAAGWQGQPRDDHGRWKDGVLDSVEGTVSALRKHAEPITAAEARALVTGKTEKPGGVEPSTFIGGNDNRVMLVGHIPLILFRANEEGDRYDGTVDLERAKQYLSRGQGRVPPILAGMLGRGGNDRLNVVDGGHRITAARLRGDRTIYAIVTLRGTAAEAFRSGGVFDSAGRAPVGGARGMNGEWYRGGTFLPNTQLPKQGSTGKKTGTGRTQVSPGEWGVPPKPGMVSIFTMFREFITVTGDMAKVFTRPDAAVKAFVDDDVAAGRKMILVAAQAYSDGMRWVDMNDFRRKAEAVTEEDVSDNGRHWLKVSFAQKDAVKAAGARWDGTERKWYWDGPGMPEALKPFAEK